MRHSPSVGAASSWRSIASAGFAWRVTPRTPTSRMELDGGCSWATATTSNRPSSTAVGAISLKVAASAGRPGLVASRACTAGQAKAHAMCITPIGRPCRRLKPFRFYTSVTPASERPLRGCGRPASGPATAEVGAWSWASRRRGTSCVSVGRWSDRREGEGVPLQAVQQVPTSTRRAQRARRSASKSRGGGTLSSRLPLQRLQARSRAVRNRVVGAPKRASPMCRNDRVSTCGTGTRRV